MKNKSSLYNRIMAHDSYALINRSDAQSCTKCGIELSESEVEGHWCFLSKAEKKELIYNIKADESEDN